MSFCSQETWCHTERIRALESDTALPHQSRNRSALGPNIRSPRSQPVELRQICLCVWLKTLRGWNACFLGYSRDLVGSLPYGNRPPAVSKSSENGPFMPRRRRGGELKASARPASISITYKALSATSPRAISGRFSVLKRAGHAAGGRFPQVLLPTRFPEEAFLGEDVGLFKRTSPAQEK